MRALLLAICFVCLLLLLLLESEAQLLAEPIVDTQYGQVLGNRKLYEGSIYDEYLGIPFAAPPVGKLRWQKPQPLEPWEGLWNATQYSIHCTQLIAPIYRFLGMGGISGEDCLYLNVWVPGGIRANNSASLPLMVYVYGGAFVVGTGEMYPGYALALHGQMIVVNFNYRVSSLGWLSTEDSSLPGNYGLWDTKAALEWIRDNIAAFNGDPAQVTIFGQSAGGMITSHAVVSAQTNSLFRNAIAISGSSTGPSGLTTQALRTAVLLADIFNCTYNTTQEIVDCLMEEDAHDLDFWGNIGMSMHENRSSNLRPVIDGDFVLRRPRESFEMGEGGHLNFVTGFCNDDSASFIMRNPVGSPFLYDKLNVAATNESMWEYMMRELGDTANPEELAASIYGVYPDLGSSDNFTRTLAASKCFTEWSFGSGSNLEAGLHRNSGGTGKTFEYYFHYRQSFLVGYPEWINGTHMDDLYSVFGWPFMEPFRRLYLNEDFDEMDLDISERIMNYYSNFVRTGDPNIGPYDVVFPWNEFDSVEQNFLRQSPDFEEGNFYEDNMVDRFYYWNEVYPTLVRYPPDPEIPPTTLVNTYEAPTARDIRLAVDSLKKTLEELIPDEEIFAEIEETIDRFLEKKNFEL